MAATANKKDSIQTGTPSISLPEAPLPEGTEVKVLGAIESEEDIGRLIDFYFSSPEHKQVGERTIQRQEPSSEEMRLLLQNPDIDKVVFSEDDGIKGLFILGPIEKIAETGASSTHWYNLSIDPSDNAAFFPPLAKDLREYAQARDPRQSTPKRFRKMQMPSILWDALDWDKLQSSILNPNIPILYFVGNGWTSDLGNRPSFLKWIEDFIALNYPNSPLIYEFPQDAEGTSLVSPADNEETGCDSGLPGINPIIAMTLEEFNGVQIGEQQYFFLGARKVKDIFRSIVTKIFPNSPEISMKEQSVENRTVLVPEDQRHDLKDGNFLQISTSVIEKRELTEELWPSYNATFHTPRRYRGVNHEAGDMGQVTIQDQSATFKEFKTILEDPTTSIFTIRDSEDNILGFWIGMFDLESIHHRTQAEGGVHSVTLDQVPEGPHAYTYTTGGEVKDTLQAILPSLLLKSNLDGQYVALEIGGDMSVTTGAAIALLRFGIKPLIKTAREALGFREQHHIWMITQPSLIEEKE
jgi:hypothetical protein